MSAEETTVTKEQLLDGAKLFLAQFKQVIESISNEEVLNQYLFGYLDISLEKIKDGISFDKPDQYYNDLMKDFSAHLSKDIDKVNVIPDTLGDGEITAGEQACCKAVLGKKDLIRRALKAPEKNFTSINILYFKAMVSETMALFIPQLEKQYDSLNEKQHQLIASSLLTSPLLQQFIVNFSDVADYTVDFGSIIEQLKNIASKSDDEILSMLPKLPEPVIEEVIKVADNPHAMFAQPPQPSLAQDLRPVGDHADDSIDNNWFLMAAGAIALVVAAVIGGAALSKGPRSPGL